MIGPAKDISQLSGPSVRDPRSSRVEEQYPAFLRNNRLRASDLRRLRNEAEAFAYRPLVSLLLPASDGAALERTLHSLADQVYPHWEASVVHDTDRSLPGHARLDGRVKAVRHGGRDPAAPANAALASSEGEYVAFVGEGDRLAPDALFRVVEALQEDGGIDLVYTDEDEVDEEGVRSNPSFKPGWSPDLLLSADYVSRLCVYRRALLEEVGGFGEGFGGHHEYDLVLRATERTGGIRHLPKVLYHRRKPADPAPTEPALDGARRALAGALERRGLEGTVEDGILPHHVRAKLGVRGEPKVSIIVPTRDNVSVLRNCIESIERLTEYRNYEVLIVDNDSVDPKTVEYLASTRHRVIRFREPFNYSRINNTGVARADGEYVLLLNDDAEITSGDWLREMLSHAQRSEVGAVGAKLVYPDGRLQHAGVLMGVGNPYGPGIAVHAHQFYPSDHAGHLGAVARVANYGAVTAACVLLRKEVFEEVGGFDEEDLKVSFNDVDLCLKIRERGYSVVYTPHAELLHHESVSRGYKGDPAEGLHMRRKWGDTLDAEPFYNPAFSAGSGDYNLRADLLRPRALREENGAPRRDFEGSYENALTAGPEELRAYVRARQGMARDSRRASLAPARGSKGVKIPPREEAEAPRPGGPAPSRQAGHIVPEQFIWMFGSPRTGSTWLSRMMAELDDQERWHEPYVGLLFGSFVYERLGENNKLLDNASFIMGGRHRAAWLDSIKNFVLDGAEARYPNLRKDQYLVIKEPNGSVGAPLMLEATPGSRLIFLIRDPRDVVASRLDAFRKGSWSSQERDLDTADRLNDFTRQLAREYRKVVSQVQGAYEAHPGKKVLVRYEDLRRDTVGALATMYEGLGMGFDKGRLRAAVERHSWEQVPKGDKGSGKFYRKATPGSWREDLTPGQIGIVEEETGPLIAEYY